jgi:aromatic-L-amino-acid/L-tryptophan decarboxylase
MKKIIFYIRNFRIFKLNMKGIKTFFEKLKNSGTLKNKFKKLFLNDESLQINANHAIEIIKNEHKKMKSSDYRVSPDIKPGFLRSVIPNQPPKNSEDMSKILSDVEKLLIPNMLHWQHPKFFGFFPSNSSDAALIAELLSTAFNTPGFTWHANPAATELENIVMDWCVQILSLPDKFLIKNQGGGTVANTIGDSILLSVIAAKYKKMKELKIECDDLRVLKFVGYYTEHSHMQHHKALCIKDIPYKKPLPVEFDEITKNFKLKPGYEKIIENDIEQGLIPFWIGSTIGTTSTGACDNIFELSDLCKKYNIYLTVDCAWAGSYFILDEYKQLAQSLIGVNSICINFAKVMLSGMSASLFYVDDKFLLTESLSGKNSQLFQNPEYLKNQFSELNDVIDYKDWQIGLGRRFNSLKIWFLIRNYGVEGLKEFIKHTLNLAEYFEKKIQEDMHKRFELICKREFSLICFRIIKDSKGNIIPQDKLNDINLKFLNLINKDGQVFMVGSKINDLYFLRAAFGTPNSTTDDVDFLWEKITQIHLNFDL